MGSVDGSISGDEIHPTRQDSLVESFCDEAEVSRRSIPCDVEEDSDSDAQSSYTAMTSQGGQTILEPPDGGYGWMIVFGCFTVNLMFAVLRLTFAIYIPELVDYFDRSIGEISLVSSVDTIVSSLMAIPSGSLTKTLGARAVCIIGLGLASAGLVLSSFVTEYYAFIITFGVVKAIGQGLLLVPSTVIVQQYFSKKRSLAVGLSSLGRSSGPMIFAPIHRLIIDAFGWRGGLRMVATMVTQCIVIAAALCPLATKSDVQKRESLDEMNTGKEDSNLDSHGASTFSDSISSVKGSETIPSQPVDTCPKETDVIQRTDEISRTPDTKVYLSSSESRPSKAQSSTSRMADLRAFFSGMAKTFEPSLLREPRFWLFMVGRSFAMSAAYAMYTFTVVRAVHFGIDKLSAALLITCIGCASLIGRFAAGLFGSMTCTNRHIFYYGMVIAGGTIVCLTTLSRDVIYMHVILNAMFGFTLGTHETLFQVVASDIFSLEKLPGCLGWSFAFQGIVCFAMLLFIGMLFDQLGNYTVAFLLAGFVQILGGLCHMVLTFILKRSERATAKRPMEEQPIPERPLRKNTIISEYDITASMEVMS